ncbi:MAG: T9SS-dependent M36 family metallopeptidase [Saprospiraceae bacterium]|nr:T9SS-dependent M36 family metallopeptidase [Saprospiraceae bacterium]
MKLLNIVFFYTISTCIIYAQNSKEIIQKFLNKQHLEHGLSQEDIKNWAITSQHTSKQSGVTYVYIQQSYQDIPVANGVANFAIKEGNVLSMGNGFINNLNTKVSAIVPTLDPSVAIENAATQLNTSKPFDIQLLKKLNNKQLLYNTANISLENIPIELMYYNENNHSVKLVWDLSIYTLDAEHWWSVKIDAHTGKLIDKIDWVTHCTFEHDTFLKCNHSQKKRIVEKSNNIASEQSMNPDQYRVLALPIESPNHGSMSIVTNPADSLSSPYGWHDTNGTIGAEHTITRGNNVYAYEDTASNNSPGFSPDGGSLLEFIFPYNDADQPINYMSAAITNLFYMNNMIHDVLYHYGFDEASGNFQVNNYGNGGQGGDYVRAEAQDGSGTNNANFATPKEGSRPRMQMYIWPFSIPYGHFLEVNSPSNIATTYISTNASFGPPLPPTPISGDLVLIEDITAPTNDGCDSIINGNQLNGKIVLIDQGTCNFTDKVQAAQDNGAIAVIIANITGFLIGMTGSSSTINIPSIMVLGSDANILKSELLLGSVNVSIDNAGISHKDSDLDNGIIAHEYAHGLSNRLTGGSNNSGCLSNEEQMGEGWSDWIALMLTIEPGDLGTDIRGMGTYVRRESTTGGGMRPAPYSTSFAINNYTYGHSNNSATISQPHGVGFIFATVLWDLTWALIDYYGGTPDPDLYNGTGGNNIAMQLVIEALKIQPCSPGMIDGRDAILQADQLLYGGAHECLIWEVFRKRGFGYSASQGSSASRSDQIEAFDMSPVCLIASAPPIAAFKPNYINSCVSTIHFSDSSKQTPHQWFWDFGDGQSSTDQNPSHSYISDGVYDVTLIVTNNMGSDSTTIQITITLPPTPIATGDETCPGDTAILIATGTGSIRWLNIANNTVHNGDTLIVDNVSSIQTFYAENLVGDSSEYIGPIDSSIGNGGYENASYHGALNFKAFQPLEIVSAWIDADGAGNRTFFLSSGYNTDGSIPTSIVDDVTVYVNDGPQRIDLNLMVPDSGDYNLGANNISLFRNTDGASYPYIIPGFLSINNSSSSSAPNDTYYFLYDLEIRTPRCISAQDTVFAIPVSSYFSYTDSNNTFNFIDNSSGAVSWLWTFGDGDSSTLQNPSHTYTQSGTYTVSLSINNGSCISTQVINVLVGVKTINQKTPKIILMPNPSKGIVNITLDNELPNEDLSIHISSIEGRILKSATILRGTTEFTLNLTQLPSAVYFIRIQGFHFSEIRKLIIE